MTADGACCAMLAAINFSSNLPAVVVNTDGATVTRTASNSSLCTCSQGLKHGDFSGEVAIKIRGGTDSRVPLTACFLSTRWQEGFASHDCSHDRSSKCFHHGHGYCQS